MKNVYTLINADLGPSEFHEAFWFHLVAIAAVQIGEKPLVPELQKPF